MTTAVGISGWSQPAFKCAGPEKRFIQINTLQKQIFNSRVPSQKMEEAEIGNPRPLQFINIMKSKAATAYFTWII